MRVVGLHAEAPNTSPNTDGINFYGGSDQLFADSFVHNGDVSHHDIAGIWVAFFSRCQRYPCRQDCVSVVPAGDPQSAQCVNEPQTCRGGDGTPPPPTFAPLPQASQPRGPSAASQ